MTWRQPDPSEIVGRVVLGPVFIDPREHYESPLSPFDLIVGTLGAGVSLGPMFVDPRPKPPPRG